MLESMLGPDKKNQLFGNGVLLAAVILAFVGMCLAVVASIHPIVHSIFWPGIAMLFIASGALIAHGKGIRLTLSMSVLLLGLWIVLNVALGINVPEVPEMDMGELLTGGVEMTEMMTDTMLQLMTAGGVVGAVGGLVGIYGSLKFSGAGTQVAESGADTQTADSGADTQTADSGADTQTAE
jgi:hypothetical protein